MTNKSPNSTVLMSVLDNYGGHPFDEVFDIVFPCYGPEELETVLTLTDKVAIVLWGGGDISPTLYNQMPNGFTQAGVDLSRRDQIEMEIALKAIELKVPIIGICRGAQMMCALSGASLVQHVEKHAGGYHQIKTNDDRTFYCPSLHHQMMYPWARRNDLPQIKFDLLAWAEPTKSKVYLGEPNNDNKDVSKNGQPVELKPPCEPEVIWIPGTKSLCIQSHPEFIENMQHPFIQYTLELTRKYILQESDGKDDNRS